MTNINQPKTIKTIRIAKKKQPMLIEGPKKTLFIRGNKTSKSVIQFMQNIRALRKQRAVSFSRKHELLPFDDHSQLQKYCQKAETSLFLFGSHSKKRPNNIIIGRTFDWKVLDMVEFGLHNMQSMQQISQNYEIPYQMQPFIVFQGSLWQQDENCQKIRNLLNDFCYQNNKIEGVELDTMLSIVICFSIEENKKIYMRVFETKVQGNNILQHDGKIVVQTLGPNVQLEIRRTMFADNQLWKKATHIPKPVKRKENKNIKYDQMGNKRGKLYMDRQDLKRIQTKKRRFIKKDVQGNNIQKKMQLQQKRQNEFGDN